MRLAAAPCSGAIREAAMQLLRRVARATGRAALRWIDDRCASMAAAVAFFSAFSLAPTLVIVVAVGGAFFGPEAVRWQVVEEMGGLLGRESAVALQGMIESVWFADAAGLKALLSLATLLVGASATFAELEQDVNLVWRTPPRPGASSVGGFLRVRLLSIGLVVGVGFLLVVSLVLDTVIQALNDAMWPPDAAGRLLMAVANQVTALALLSATFALLMSALVPRMGWRSAVLGAVVASVLFNMGKSVFGLYLARAGTADAFGAAGSLAVILMWLFFSASVFLYGVAYARVWSE
jgi:membrane protein